MTEIIMKYDYQEVDAYLLFHFEQKKPTFILENIKRH